MEFYLEDPCIRITVESEVGDSECSARAWQVIISDNCKSVDGYSFEALNLTQVFSLLTEVRCKIQPSSLVQGLLLLDL